MGSQDDRATDIILALEEKWEELYYEEILKRKKKESFNPSVRKKTFFRFWLKRIVRWDFMLTQPKTERRINKLWEDQFWKFSFVYLYKTYHAKSLLYKHCKEGGNCYNPFLGYSPNSFLFLKKNTNSVVLNDIVLFLSLDAHRQGKKEIFSPTMPLSLSIKNPKPIRLIPISLPREIKQRRQALRVALWRLPSHPAYLVWLDRVGWLSSSFPLINTRAGRTKEKGILERRFWMRGDCLRTRRDEKKINRHYKEKNTTKEIRDYRRGEK